MSWTIAFLVLMGVGGFIAGYFSGYRDAMKWASAKLKEFEETVRRM